MRKFNFFSSKSGAWILLAAILAVVFFSYYPVLKSDFVAWDDDVHVYENIDIRTLDLGQTEAKTAATQRRWDSRDLYQRLYLPR